MAIIIIIIKEKNRRKKAKKTCLGVAKKSTSQLLPTC
jgi:hypothetical protein